MAKYKIALTGDSADADDTRADFETLIRQLRFAGEVSGTLELDGVPYMADDVSEEAPGADTDDETPEPEPAAV